MSGFHASYYTFFLKNNYSVSFDAFHLLEQSIPRSDTVRMEQRILVCMKKTRFSKSFVKKMTRNRTGKDYPFSLELLTHKNGPV